MESSEKNKCFGAFNENNVFQLSEKFRGSIETIYGQQDIVTDALFGIYEEEQTDCGVVWKEHIFVGECPHQNEDGKWVTYNEVPQFYIFKGKVGVEYGEQHMIEPYPITLKSSKDYYQRIETLEQKAEDYVTLFNDTCKAYDNMSFVDYLHILRKQIINSKYSLRTINYTLRNTARIVGIYRNCGASLQFVRNFKTSSAYISFVTDKCTRRIIFKKDGKCTLKFEKYEHENSNYMNVYDLRNE